MNYCSIEDAWGKPDQIKNQLSQHNNTTHPVVHSIQTNNVNQESFPQYNHECMMFIRHLKMCKSCQKEMGMLLNKPKLIEKFQEMVDDNKDTIVLILMAISLLLFFNLINNITKN